MRTFIALLFDEEKKDIIFDILQEVKLISHKGNFTSIGNLHLTMIYIGETSQDELEAIKKKLEEVKIKQFNYLTSKIKYFTKGDNQKIIYLGVEKSDKLFDLYRSVVKKLNDLGHQFHLEKYTPHITLGRKVTTKKLESVSSIYCNPLEMSALKISIMESKRVNNKLVYEEIYSIPLEQVVFP